MGKRLRKSFLDANPELVFECYFCGEDVEREDVVVRHEEPADPDSPAVPAHRKCHNENTSPI